jgi:hypothetical protein
MDSGKKSSGRNLELKLRRMFLDKRSPLIVVLVGDGELIRYIY